MQFLKKQGFKNVVGIDKSAEQIRLARERGCEAYVADAFDFLKTNSNKFDMIIAIDFLEHFSRDELVRLAPLISASLANSGRLIIQTVNGQGISAGHIIYGDLTHLTIFTPDSLRQLLNFAGFSEFVFSETALVPKNILSLFRLILWKCISRMASFVKMIETGRSQKIWTENMICCCRKHPDLRAEKQ
jgi:2-polyprenyl-3-methyl-5-hydroxy-6-metoxy-1,4-benzoquinol methylase